MRQSIRKAIILISFLLFPITLNYFSPYISVDGAIYGIASGSLLLFGFLFLTSVFWGRAWCGWLCPMAGLSEMAQGVNSKNVNTARLKIIRYSIFVVWAGFILAMFVLAGGIKGIDPLHLADGIISVDAPAKYIIYYFVLAISCALSFFVGKRGFCHSICWMSPFLVAGTNLGKLLKIPQLKIIAQSSMCTGCGICNKKCPMSIDVKQCLKEGSIKSSDCILCGECMDSCPKKVLSYGYNVKAIASGLTQSR